MLMFGLHRWLDETPTARIIARCTQDMRTVDGPIPQSLYWVFSEFIGMLTKLSVIVIFSPMFLFPGIAVAILGISMGNLYLKAQLSVKREMRYTRLLTRIPYRPHFIFIFTVMQGLHCSHTLMLQFMASVRFPMMPSALGC